MPIREREAQAAPRPRCDALERIANEGNAKRTTELNDGHVASASSFASVEQVAREQPDAKGVIWERCAHACKAEMEQWVAGQKTTRGAFSVEQLFTRVEDAGTAQPSKRAKVLSTMSDTDIAALVAGPQDVQAACQKVVAWLPPALRGPMSRDASALAEILLRLCPGATWLTIQVEIVDHLGTCTRWHQDRYTARALITYTGPGTWCVDDASVRYDQFAKTVYAPMEESDARIVPNFNSIHRPQSNAVVLMKGNDWPGIRGVGLTHKAPNDLKPGLKRLIIKVDLVNGKRPEIGED